MLPLLHLLLLAQPAPVAEAEIPAEPAAILDASLLLRYTATRADPQTWFSVDSSGNLDTAALLLPRPLHHFGSVVAFFGAELEPIEGISVRTLIDSGELRTGDSLEPPLDDTVTSDGQSIGDALLNLERIKELALQLSWGWGAVEAGRRLAVVGESLVFEDFATGVAVSAELGGLGLDDWTAEAGGYVVGYDLAAFEQPNGFVHLRVGYDLSLFESVGVFGAVLMENGLLTDTLVSALSEGIVVNTVDPIVQQTTLKNLFLAERDSSGYLGYAGADVQLLPAEGLSVRGVATGAFGRVDVQDRVSFQLSSWAATAEVSYGITSKIGVGTFLVAMSGDQPPRPAEGEADYHGFIAVAPYWTWTGLFFSGGLTQGLYPGQAAAAGVNGHGVVVGGARAELSTDDVWTEVRLAGLWALARPPPVLGGSGAFYGVEADLLAEWQPFDWLGLGVEFDLLRPGSFFQRQDVAFRAIGQVHVRAGN